MNQLNGNFEEVLHLRDYLVILNRRKWLVLLSLLAVLIPAVIYNSNVSPIYEATATIRIQRNQQGQITPTPYVSFSGYDYVQTEMQILKSRSLGERVVKELGLNVNIITSDIPRGDVFSNLSVDDTVVVGKYELELIPQGKFKLYNQGQEIFDGRLGEKVSVQGLNFTLSPTRRVIQTGRISFRISDLSAAATAFTSNIKVTPLRGTNIVKVSMSGTDKRLITQMVNTLTEVFVQQNKDYTQQSARAVTEYLENQMDLVSDQLKISESALQDFKEKSKIITLESKIGQENESLAEFEAQRAQAVAEHNSLLNLLGKLKANGSKLPTSANADYENYRQIASHPSLITNTTIQTLKQNLIALEAEKVRLKNEFTEAHPDIVSIDAQIQSTAKELKNAAESYLRGLESQIGALTSAINLILGRIEKLPQAEVELAKYMRDFQVNENLYTLLLTRYQEARISEQNQIGDISTVDSALEPRVPIGPQRKRNLILAFIMGLLLGVGLALFLNYMDSSIKTAEDVERYLQLPHLCSIPKIKINGGEPERLAYGGSSTALQLGSDNHNSNLITRLNPNSVVAEAYRALRTSIQYSVAGSHDGYRLQTLMVTSANPSEGKTTTLANLGVIMAQMGTKTLIIDTDLRRSKLHKIFDKPKEPGLTNVLIGKAPLAEAIKQTDVRNLYILSSGTLPPNPSELIDSSLMRRLLEVLKTKFPIILFDTPPLLAVTDAVVLSSHVDGVIYVVRSSKTEQFEATRGKELLDSVKGRIVGVVVNEFEASKYRYYKKSHDNYYYNSYSYSGGEYTVKPERG